MIRVALLSLSVLLLPVAFVCAENPQVTALHNQVKGLKAEKPIVIKNIEAQYDLMLRRERVEEAVITAEIKVLNAQEAALLKVAQTDQEKAAIRTQYETIKSYLKVGKKLDEADRAKLRAMRKAHVSAVNNAYAARIAYLNAAAKSLAGSARPKK